MDKIKFIGGMTLLLIIITAGIFYWFEQNKTIKNKQVTCLASIIPKVVLHHNQEEIVNLLQDLAKETGDLAPEKAVKTQAPPIFSQRIDEKLIEIANLYQAQDQADFSKGTVALAIDQAASYFKKDAPEFLGECMNILSRAESQCGSLEKVTDDNRDCLNSFTPKIMSLMDRYLKPAQ